MFCMRGFYPQDIHSLSSSDLDYDFEREIDSIKKGYYDEKIIGRQYVYMHRRHKSDYPMNMILFPPIKNLIALLRKLVSITHTHISFCDFSEFLGTKKELIKSKAKEDIDFMKIFAITNTNSPKLFSNTWRLYRRRAKEIGLPEFKVARKTFMTISDELGISDSYGRALLGQNDPSISKFYKDMSRPRIVGKLAYFHLSILREFDVINLLNYLCDHLSKLFANDHKEWFLMHKVNYSQDFVYDEFEKHFLGLLEKRDVRSLEI